MLAGLLRYGDAMSGAELTANGVCYNLKRSPYTYEYFGFRFYFSSRTHLKNFVEKATMKQEWLCDSLTRRFKYDVDASTLAVFQLYNTIETRGFHVVRLIDEKSIEDRNDLHFTVVVC